MEPSQEQVRKGCLPPLVPELSGWGTAGVNRPSLLVLGSVPSRGYLLIFHRLVGSLERSASFAFSTELTRTFKPTKIKSTSATDIVISPAITRPRLRT